MVVRERGFLPGSVLDPRYPWDGRRVVLGVTGGIAAYKVVQLARDLTCLGAIVDTILTNGARQFVQPLSFEGVTGRPVLTDLFSSEGAALHVRLGQDADVVCVAPATADFMARAAHGRADDLLTTTLLASHSPVILCPAMNDQMFAHPQTQSNIAHLKDHLSYRIAGPAVGPLAFGEGRGPGRMLEVTEIIEEIGRVLAAPSPLEGKHVLVTTGPTREPIDPVRYVGNRSSGRMGLAIAKAAWRRGAKVTVVSGPVYLEDPYGSKVIKVETAQEMFHEVSEVLPGIDLTIFTSAVSDFRPINTSKDKIKRSDVGTDLMLNLTENPDIARETQKFRKPGSITVGFALETDSLLDNSREKLQGKGFNLLVYNNVTEEGAGFEVDTNRVTLITPMDSDEELPLLKKEEIAEIILDRAISILERN